MEHNTINKSLVCNNDGFLFSDMKKAGIVDDDWTYSYFEDGDVHERAYDPDNEEVIQCRDCSEDVAENRVLIRGDHVFVCNSCLNRLCRYESVVFVHVPHEQPEPEVKDENQIDMFPDVPKAAAPLDDKIKRMHLAYGKGLCDKKCGQCKMFLREAYHNGRYKKCIKYGQSRGAGTDWKVSYPACGLFDEDENNA